MMEQPNEQTNAENKNTPPIDPYSVPLMNTAINGNKESEDEWEYEYSSTETEVSATTRI